MTRTLLLRFPLLLALSFALTASQCLPPDDDDDAAGDDDDVTGGDDDDDDDDATPPPDTVISGEVIAIDRATNVELTSAQYAARAGGIVLYVLPDASDLSEVLTKVTMDGPGPYEVTLEGYVGPVDVIAVADEDKNFFIDSSDVAREYAFNPLAATGADIDEVDVYVDLVVPTGGGGGGGNPDCASTQLAGSVDLVGVPDGDVAVSTNSTSLASGPWHFVERYAAGPFSLAECDWRGETALLGYLDSDDNGYFEPADDVGEAAGNPFILGIGDVSGVHIEIPSIGPIDIPAPAAYVGLTGTVSYGSFSTGDILVFASHLSTDGQVFSQAILAAPGPFAVIAPAGTEDVLVWAVLDADGDGEFDIGADPFDADGPLETGSGVSGITLDLGAAPTGSVGGTITSLVAPAAGDVLHIGLFDSAAYDPAAGPPVDFLEIPNPTLPYSYSFSDVLSGTYWVGSYIDVGGDDPFTAGDGDPEGQVGPVLLPPGGNATGLDVTLSSHPEMERTMSTLRLLPLLLALALVTQASKCIDPGDDDDASGDDDDVGGDDDDASDDDDLTPPGPFVITGEVIGLDRDTGVELTSAQYAARAGGIIVYALATADDLSDVFEKVTMTGPGAFEIPLDISGPFDLIAVADEDQNLFINDEDTAREYAFNPLAAVGDDIEDVVIYIDLPVPDSDGGGGGGDDDDAAGCETVLSGTVSIIDLPEGSVAVTSNTADLGSGPIEATFREGSGPFTLVEECSGTRGLLGYLDGDDNGYFEPSDPIGEATANPFTLGLGDVAGVTINIPTDDVEAPAPVPYVGISGTVSYAAFSTGDVLVHASHVTTDGYVFSQVTLAAPGPFSLIAPADTEDVLVWAVLDSDGDGEFDTAVDPFDSSGPGGTGSGLSGIVLDLGPAALGSISGSVAYAGPVAAADVLHIGLFETDSYDPAAGPPIDFVEVTSPGFPSGFSFVDVPSGTYWVGAWLDIDGDDPFSAGEDDPETQVGPYLLPPGGSVSGVTLTLPVP